MQSTALLAATTLLAAAISSPSFAGDRTHKHARDRQHAAEIRPSNATDSGMQTVPNSAVPDAPGYGWRYFTDPVARRAVVISPQGDYYYSRGNGLRWVAAEQI